MRGLAFDVRVRLLSTESGGRKSPIRSDYRPSWALGNTWHGSPVTNDARVVLEGISQLAPGDEGPAILEPVAAEYWGAVAVGAVLPMLEGNHLVGYATVTKVSSRPEHLTREVSAFVLQARQFCDFVENASSFPLDERVAIARRRLLELYAAGCELPLVEPPAGCDVGPSPAPPGSWVGLEDLDAYWQVLDPYVADDPVAGSLSDDLLDVYSDVRLGLQSWDSSAPDNAIWQWRFHFDAHWGDHAINALRALHRACRV